MTRRQLLAALRRRVDAPVGRWALLGSAAAVAWAAQAQPIPYSQLQGAGASLPASERPYTPSGSPLADALNAARRGDTASASSIAATLADPVARKLVLWAEIENDASAMSFAELDLAQRDLAGWPHPAKRRAAAERALDGAGLSPTAVIGFFDGKEPATAEGAMALAGALQAQGLQPEAEALVRRWWRDRVFDADVQGRMLARYGIWLTPDDHAHRASVLLYGARGGSAVQAILPLLGAEQQALAQARLALRSDRSDAPQLVSALPYALQSDPGLLFDRARYLRKHSLDAMGAQLLASAAAAPPSADAGEASWSERRSLMQAALKAHDTQGAYRIAANNGMSAGTDYTEAEFFAGWIALTKLRQPMLADGHFQNIESAGQTPVTLSRAYYWRGRAAEAAGDRAKAQTEYRLGSVHVTAFYGQLAAEKAGLTRLTLPAEPTITPAERAVFAAREPVRAARLLGDAGARETFRSFVLGLDDDLPTAADYAQLVDLVHGYGEQDLAMRVARSSGMKGFPLPVRGWPLRTPPMGGDLPDPAFTLAITRQESGFDPNVRSGAGARGMMQLMPATASIVARRIGVSYSPAELDDPDYNMRLGAAYLGQIQNDFSGSYVLAAAGYNAGPGRAAQWIGDCGDPRQSSLDPADFLECIPFTETRNYVERVMENVEVYRARLAGGSAPLQLTADLHRGGWTPGYVPASVATLPSADGATRLPPPTGGAETR